MLQHGVDDKDAGVIVTGIERMCVCVCTLRPNEGRMRGELAPTGLKILAKKNTGKIKGRAGCDS